MLKGLFKLPITYALLPAPETVALAPRPSVLAPVVIFPAVNVKVFVTVVEALKVTPLALLMVRLLTVAGKPVVTWAAPPLKSAVELPLMARVLAPTVMFPLVKASVPFTVVEALKVTPLALVMVRLLTVAGRPRVTWAAVPLKV